METRIKVLLYGEDVACFQAVKVICTVSASLMAEGECLCVSYHETLRKQLVDWNPDLIIVLANRSEGMEGVYLAKEIRPEVPVFWFSDDVGFGMQSHRLECDYFAVKPFTAEKLRKAFQRCARMGIRIAGAPVPSFQ